MLAQLRRHRYALLFLAVLLTTAYALWPLLVGRHGVPASPVHGHAPGRRSAHEGDARDAAPPDPASEPPARNQPPPPPAANGNGRPGKAAAADGQHGHAAGAPSAAEPAADGGQPAADDRQPHAAHSSDPSDLSALPETITLCAKTIEVWYNIFACPAHYTITKVLMAAYGKPTGECASNDLAPNPRCNVDVTPQIESHCLGRRVCDIVVRESHLKLNGKQPCADDRKHVAIKLLCTRHSQPFLPVEIPSQPRAMVTRAPDVCDPRLVHVVFSQSGYFRPLLAAINSVLANSKRPEDIYFHLITNQELAKDMDLVFGDTREPMPSTADRETAQDYVREVLKTYVGTTNADLYYFANKRLQDIIGRPEESRLANELNYARNYLPDVIPECITKVIYLDTDLMLTGPIEDMWEISMDGKIFATPEFCQFRLSPYFMGRMWSDPKLFPPGTSREKYARKSGACYINPGVGMIDLKRWKAADISSHMEYWMSENLKSRIYKHGSMPPFMLEFSGPDLRNIDQTWNHHDLGFKCCGINRTLGNIMHWSGTVKPFLPWPISNRVYPEKDEECPCGVQRWYTFDIRPTRAQSLALDNIADLSGMHGPGGGGPVACDSAVKPHFRILKDSSGHACLDPA